MQDISDDDDSDDDGRGGGRAVKPPPRMAAAAGGGGGGGAGAGGAIFGASHGLAANPTASALDSERKQRMEAARQKMAEVAAKKAAAATAAANAPPPPAPAPAPPAPLPSFPVVAPRPVFEPTSTGATGMGVSGLVRTLTGLHAPSSLPPVMPHTGSDAGGGGGGPSLHPRSSITISEAESTTQPPPPQPASIASAAPVISGVSAPQRMIASPPITPTHSDVSILQPHTSAATNTAIEERRVSVMQLPPPPAATASTLAPIKRSSGRNQWTTTAGGTTPRANSTASDAVTALPRHATSTSVLPPDVTELADRSSAAVVAPAVSTGSSTVESIESSVGHITAPKSHLSSIHRIVAPRAEPLPVPVPATVTAVEPVEAPPANSDVAVSDIAVADDHTPPPPQPALTASAVSGVPVLAPVEVEHPPLIARPPSPPPDRNESPAPAPSNGQTPSASVSASPIKPSHHLKHQSVSVSIGGGGPKAQAAVNASRDEDETEWSEADIRLAFLSCDVDGNGFLGVSDLRSILGTINAAAEPPRHHHHHHSTKHHHRHKSRSTAAATNVITDAELDEMTALVDTDGDGQCDFFAFRRMVYCTLMGVSIASPAAVLHALFSTDSLTPSLSRDQMSAEKFAALPVPTKPTPEEYQSFARDRTAAMAAAAANPPREKSKHRHNQSTSINAPNRLSKEQQNHIRSIAKKQRAALVAAASVPVPISSDSEPGAAEESKAGANAKPTLPTEKAALKATISSKPHKSDKKKKHKKKSSTARDDELAERELEKLRQKRMSVVGGADEHDPVSNPNPNPNSNPADDATAADGADSNRFGIGGVDPLAALTALERKEKLLEAAKAVRAAAAAAKLKARAGAEAAAGPGAANKPVPPIAAREDDAVVLLDTKHDAGRADVKTGGAPPLIGIKISKAGDEKAPYVCGWLSYTRANANASRLMVFLLLVVQSTGRTAIAG